MWKYLASENRPNLNKVGVKNPLQEITLSVFSILLFIVPPNSATVWLDVVSKVANEAS